MVDTLSTPWDFHNNDKKLFSPDSFSKVIYYDLSEIAMGAPIGGLCFLETADNQKIKIHDWCGGPPVWETTGYVLAIPIWTKNYSKGTIQQIGLVDSKTKKLKIFSKIFRVLDLHSFDKNIISGYDSPIHNKTTVTFDVDKEKVDAVIELNV